MNNFKINFKLQELDKIMPFGQTPNLSLHWFGLTDGLLWIEAGAHTIYEYSQAAQRYFDNTPRYNDYQISRFLEDFSDTFRYVGESIPEVLYHNLEIFDNKMSAWKELYEDKDDDIFDEFYFNEYHELRDWYWNRSFDSAHLIGGPYIGCFRCGDKLKIIWESTYELDDGNSIWSSPKGCVELTYEGFINGVEEFFKAFFAEMDRQVDNAIEKDWKSISLDKEMLAWENGQRKEGFLQQLSLLRNTGEKTDWDKVAELYLKMENEIEGVTYMQNNKYLISETTKEERIALIKSWIPEDEVMDGCDIDLWDMYADYINGTKEIAECNAAFKAEYYVG